MQRNGTLDDRLDYICSAQKSRICVEHMSAALDLIAWYKSNTIYRWIEVVTIDLLIMMTCTNRRVIRPLVPLLGLAQEMGGNAPTS